MATSQTNRDRILDALQDLPGDATYDDAIERLVFLAKIEAGLAELDEGKGVSHAEAKRGLGLWPRSSGLRNRCGILRASGPTLRRIPRATRSWSFSESWRAWSGWRAFQSRGV